MNFFKKTILLVVSIIAMSMTSQVIAADSNSVVGAGGYDLVSYHKNNKPVQGSGRYVVVHDNVNYLFSSAENAKTFENNKSKYLPAYGGYCAYGAAMGKKFIADPTVWEVVDGKLYLNLDSDVQALWSKDIPSHIEQADEHWKKIKNVAAASL